MSGNRSYGARASEEEDMRDLLRARGLYAGGTLEEVQMRIFEEAGKADEYEYENDDAPVESWTKVELQDWLRSRSLPVSGNKPDLLRRVLVAARQEAARVQEAEAEAVRPLETWTKQQLQQWLREEQQYAGGTKRELVERVYALLAAADEEEEAEDTEGSDDLGPPVEEWSKAELRQWLREEQQYDGGSRDELVARVVGILEARAAEESTDNEGDSPASSVDGLAADLSNLSVLQGSAPRRRALIIACSYRGTPNELNGTLPDADRVVKLLVQSFGYSPDEMHILRDDFPERHRHPTKTSIKNGMEWLMHNIRPGSSLFFYFSGHGGQEVDRSGTERTGFNQTICPLDVDESGPIKDTYLHTTLVKPLPQGATLHALVDSCHSGTILNLPYNAVTKAGKFEHWSNEYPTEKLHKWNTNGGTVYQFSAAKSDEYAKECASYSRGVAKYSGAATHAFCAAVSLRQKTLNLRIGYGDLLQAMHDELRQDRRFLDQTPTLSSSTTIDCWKVKMTM